MQITLTEHDLEQAVRLYIANSGVVRSVSSLKFARKLSGEDAGITVNLDLAEEEITAEGLKELAMSVAAARGINATATPAAKPAEPIKKGSVSDKAIEADALAAEPEPDHPTLEESAPVVDLGAAEDEQIRCAADDEQYPAESAFADDSAATVDANPFGEDVVETEAVSAELTEAETAAAVDYQPEAIDNPFGGLEAPPEEPVEAATPENAKSNADLAANLFG